MAAKPSDAAATKTPSGNLILVDMIACICVHTMAQGRGEDACNDDGEGKRGKKESFVLSCGTKFAVDDRKSYIRTSKLGSISYLTIDENSSFVRQVVGLVLQFFRHITCRFSRGIFSNE